jgi:hypothetical protein
MAQDQSDDFHVRPGRVGSRGTRVNPRGNLRSEPFLKQVQVAVRRAGGETPSRRAYICSVNDKVEVDDAEIRIVGRKSSWNDL